MKVVLLAVWILLCAAVVSVGFIRLAPSDPMVWNRPLDFEADATGRNWVRSIVSAGPDGLARFDEIALATPRTKRLAGSVSEGRTTYVTRSKWIGFPDYTTVQQDGDRLRIYARARFGRSDLGVNEARAGRWIGRLQAR